MKQAIRKSMAVVSVFLATSMTTACGSAAGTDNAADMMQETAESDAIQTAAPETGTGFPVGDSVTLSVFGVQLASVADIEQNTVFQDLEKYTGVHFDLNMAPQDGAAEKLNLMLASGDYPEVIVGSGLSKQDLEKYGAQEHIFISLNDLIDKYGTNLKERFAEHPNWEKEMMSSDGNIYGIPSVDSGGAGHGDCSYKMWINSDWLKAVGKEMPATTDEFRDVLMAFKTQDPNGNGQADEIPLTGAINTWAGDPYLNLLNAFGYFNTDYYYVKDGKVQSILDQDYLREGLRYIHGLYEDGLIDPAAFTQDESQMAAIGNNESIAIVGAATCGHIGMLTDINNKDRYKQYEIMLPLKGNNGYQAIPYTTEHHVSGGAFVITDACKHPELAMQIADLFCGEEWTIRAQVGIEGKQWDKADADSFGMDGVTPAKYKYLSYNTQTESSQSVDKWDWTMRLIEPDWKNLFEVQGDILDPTNYEARLMQDTMKLKPYAADVDSIALLGFSEDDGAAYSQMSTAIGDYAKNAIVEFITGTRNIEKDWDAYLADLENLQYKQMLELIQKAVDVQ